MIKTSTSYLLISLSVLLLTQCGGMRSWVKDRPVEKLPTLSASRAGGAGNAAIRAVQKRALVQIRAGDAARSTAPVSAYRSYLAAARAIWQSEDESLLPYYNYAVGQAAVLLVKLHNEPSIKEVGDWSVKRGSLARITELIPADHLKISGWRTRVKQSGVGAAMVARYGQRGGKHDDQKSEVRGKLAFIPEGGIDIPLSVVLEFTAGGRARFSFIDPTRESTVVFWGQRRGLTMDLTASSAMTIERSRVKGLLADIRGVFTPAKFEKQMGLYSLQRFDRKKIPLIFVHGLVADPTTWSNTINELMVDPTVRRRYQIYIFYYPTGLPVRVTGVAFAKELRRLENHYARLGVSSAVRRTVVVGHSMGGLLTSMQIRKFDRESWKRLTYRPYDTLVYGPQDQEYYKKYASSPSGGVVDRAVFIATPHRGSKLADIWIGRVVMSLIRIPQKVLELNVPEATRSLTEFGRTVVNGDAAANGVRSLQLNNPGLKLIMSAPVVKGVPYHSIIGDRGRGDTPNSSDGVVSYYSSHLEEAESEVIVPSGHSAHAHPKAVRELRRILTKHAAR
ncbi:MAG: esterase/lipase family protein [Akkermansiaceae bacterium]